MDENKTKCLVCGQTTKKMTRGLCSRHYLQFKREREDLAAKEGEEAAAEWEAWLIQNEKLMAPNQGKKPNSQNDFSDLKKQFDREKTAELKALAIAKIENSKKTKE